jgi:hypothetical protein
MAGILSSIFDSGSAEGPSDQMAHAYVSPDDSFDDEGDGTQGAQSFNPEPSDNPNDGGAGDTGGPVGPPTNAYLEDQSGGADSSGF